MTGATPPFSLVVIIEAPGKYADQDFSLSIDLREEATGTVVQMPGPSGQMEALRIAQASRFEKMRPPPGAHVADVLPVRLQVNVAFSNGLPLKPSALYSWRVELDGQHRKAWAARFAVLGPVPGPVIGGPAGPASIPGLPHD